MLDLVQLGVLDPRQVLVPERWQQVQYGSLGSWGPTGVVLSPHSQFSGVGGPVRLVPSLKGNHW